LNFDTKKMEFRKGMKGERGGADTLVARMLVARQRSRELRLSQHLLFSLAIGAQYWY
jgi:hypothetical protein